MTVTVENEKLCVEYGDGWEKFMATDNAQWMNTIKEAEAKLAKKPRKGRGKGKRGH